MSVFKIKASSRFIYELAFLAITFSGIFLGFYLGKTDGNDVYIFIVTLVGLPLVIFIPDLLSTATSEWTFTEYGIHIKWLSRFLFNSKNDINIKWQDIQEYKYEPITYFEKQINEYNEKDLNILYPIKRRKTFYETKFGVAMAILTAICLLGIPLLFNAFPRHKEIDWWPLWIGYSGGIYFISKVIA